MPEPRSPTLKVRARGPLAIFSRPELKVERVSYPVPTPSAMRGMLEAICWKPAIAWHIERILVLNPIRFTAFRRNEVTNKGSAPTATIVTHGGPPPELLADSEDYRAQRNTVALCEVDYQVEAHFTLTPAAGASDNLAKFVAMFTRRVEQGQAFHQPYLGCRECVADILPPLEAPQPVDDTRDLGLMLWDLEYTKQRQIPRFFRAQLLRGVLTVPLTPELEAAP